MVVIIININIRINTIWINKRHMLKRKNLLNWKHLLAKQQVSLVQLIS